MKMSWQGILDKNDIQSNKGKSFSQEEAIDLMVSLSSTDANSEKKWRCFYTTLSTREL